MSMDSFAFDVELPARSDEGSTVVRSKPNSKRGSGKLMIGRKHYDNSTVFSDKTYNYQYSCTKPKIE
jgi:hypothetical protein